MWLWNLTDDLAKHYSTSSVLHQAVCIISKPWVNLNWSYSPETLNLGQDRWFFVLCNLEIWWMTLKNNRAPLLCCFKLCASLHSHQWIQIEVTVQKIELCASFQSQLWVQASVTVRKCSIWVKISFFFVLCDFEIWWTTLKNNMAPLLYYIKLCTSFQSHGWIQTGVTVRKCSNRVKIDDDLSCVSLKFDGWPWKTIGHLFYVASGSVHHFTAISEFKLELLARNTQFGSKSMFFFVPCDLEIWHDLEKQ